MYIVRTSAMAWLTIGIAVLMPAVAGAQTYSTLFNCDSTVASPYASLIQGSDGNYYGTASQGRSYGTVFKMTPAGSVTILHAFTNSDGASPYGALVLGSDGNFYGTTLQGGSHSDGTVFQLTTGGTLTALYNFSGSADGASPYGKLVQATDGNFYGVTAQGGSSGYGTVYKITSGGTLTTLHNFTAAKSDASTPRDGLIQATDGFFYGTTSAGGANGQGTAYKISSAGNFTLLHSFGSTEGYTPYAALVEGTDGNFYGTTYNGGTKSLGTVFSMTSSGKTTTLYSFSGTDGKYPASSLIEGTDGNLYGTTYQGGDAIYGTVFTITTGGYYTRLHSFTGSDGEYPAAALIQAGAGLFLGTTSIGGNSNKGVFFSISYTAAAPPAPSIRAGGVVPVYSSVNTVEAGEWVSIYGAALAGSTFTWNGDFPTSLGNTSVTIDGKPAYLWYVSPGQINLQVPNDTTTGAVPVVVTTPNGVATSTVTLAPVSPSFSLLGDNKHVAGIILRSDNSGAYGGGSYDIIGPTGTSLGYPTVAAKAGDTVELFGVGFGPTSPSVSAGQSYTGAAPTTNAVSLTVNSLSVAVAFSGLSSAGLYQLNLTIPLGLGTGDVPIQALVGGLQTPSGVVIALQ